VETTFDLLTLALVPGLSPLGARALLARGPLRSTLDHPEDHADLLEAPAVAALRGGEARRAAAAELERSRRLAVDVVGRDDGRYPQWLRSTHTPPLVLWVKGRLVLEEGSRSVAVVGSRAASPLGLALARRLAEGLAAAGVVVVSGLARGIDAAAHCGALQGHGRTVAILGSGLDRLYPPENEALSRRIEEASGAVVSEFPLGTRPWKSHFPRRNRVIAGWARAVVVVEAGARSGALSTARSALEEGRDVMAVPGHPSDPQAEGTNALLRDGAAVVRGAQDVLDELGFAVRQRGQPAPDDSVLRAMTKGVPATVDEIRERSGLALPALLARLSALELAGQIERLPGALFVREAAPPGYTRP
jgi:DNA processing protein